MKTQSRDGCSITLYTSKAERERAEAEYQEQTGGRQYVATREAARSLPKRRAAVSAFLRSGKLPPARDAFSDFVKQSRTRIMSDEEARRIVFPGVQGSVLSPPSFAYTAADRTLESPARRYLDGLVCCRSASGNERKYACGCIVYGYHDGSERVTACERHAPALDGGAYADWEMRA